MISSIYIKKEEDKGNNSIYLGGLGKFWHLNKDNDEYVLSCEDFIKRYKSIDDVNKEFISLEAFLEKARYIGYQFQRKAPIKDLDDEFDSNYTRFNGYSVYIALYEVDGVILAYHMNSRFEQYDYVVIPRFYTKDGKYEFIGKDAFISYKDIIYKQIIKQEDKEKESKLVLTRD